MCEQPIDDEQIRMINCRLDSLQISSDRNLETLVRIYGSVSRLEELINKLIELQKKETTERTDDA